MIFNILLLIHAGSAVSPAEYKAGVELGHLTVDLIGKLAKHLKDTSDDVRREIRDQQKWIEKTAEVNIDDFTKKIARASSELESTVMEGDALLEMTLTTTEKQLEILNTEFRGARFHPIIVKAAKRELLGQIELAAEGMKPLLVKIDGIKGDMREIHDESITLSERVQSKWTPEAINDKATTMRWAYFAGLVCPIAGGVQIATCEGIIATWKSDLKKSQKVVSAIQEKFDQIKQSALELADCASSTRQKYTTALKDLKMAKSTMVQHGITEGEVDTMGETVTRDDSEFAWTTQVIPSLESLKQKLIDALKA